MHYRGGIGGMMVVRSCVRPPDLYLTIAPYNNNKDGRILYQKAEIPQLRRHLIKYKAYWTRLVSGTVGEYLLAITN